MGDVLDTRAWRGISSYEPTELVVTARAGTPLAELEAALAEQGQCLPFEPPRLGEAHLGGGTVGGMVAAGLAGPARAAAGSVRDHVLGATLLNGRGELLNFGGTVIKNVAGYDVSRLLAGSLGVLGVICEVSLKVLPLPADELTLRFDLDEAGALRRMNLWAGLPLPLRASAWWQGVLVLKLAGARAAVAAAAQRLGGEPIDPALAAHFWADLRDQRDEFFAAAAPALAEGCTLWSISVPATAAPLGLPGAASAPNAAAASLIEWGGARRWLLTDAPADTVRRRTADFGGHATLYRSAERSAAPFAPLSAPVLRIHQALKRSFDPAGVFNRQRLHPEL
jgi:FAD/FMN-containing dehydrogenase